MQVEVVEPPEFNDRLVGLQLTVRPRAGDIVLDSASVP